MPDDDTPPAQVWELAIAGRHHRVESRGSVRRRLRWSVDGVVVTERRTSDDKVQLKVRDRPEIGELTVRFSALGRPQRATVLEPDESPEGSARAPVGLGGIDLEPAPGSPADRHEATVRAHPRRYALRAALAGVGRIVGPLAAAAVFGWLASLVPWGSLPSIPWPDLPRLHVPWPDLPDLPSIPWPDLPSIPWPDWTLPGWVEDVAWLVHLVWPVAIGLALAAAEIRRRRAQDRLRADRAAAEPSDADRRSAGTTGR